MSKIQLTGRDPHGMKVVVETESSETAIDLVAFWRDAGFTDVRMTPANLRHAAGLRTSPASVPNSGSQ